MSIKWPEYTNIKNAAVQTISQKIKRFSRSEDGNIAIMFGLTCVVLAVTMGGAIDYMRFNRHKTQLLSAMDASALALSSHPNLTTAESEAFVTDYVKNMVPNGDDQLFVINGFTVNPSPTGNGYEVVSDAVMETTLLQVIGVTQMELAFSTAVEKNSNYIELALALDNTGSMRSSGKIEALRDAATILVDVMYESPDSGDRTKIGLVPFVTTVNIKDTTTTGSFNSSWIDMNGQAKHNGENFDDVDPVNYPKHHAALYSASGVQWKGCVEARAEPYDTELAPPVSGDTLFVQFFSPDMDRNMGDYSNDYIDDPEEVRYWVSTGWRSGYWVTVSSAPPAHITQRDPSRYYTETVSSRDHYSSGYGPNRGCPRPLVDLTNDKDMLYAEIAAMEGWSGGGTNIAMGQFWAWNLLDPDEPFSTALPFTDKDVVKAMVVLTDGENVITNPGGSTNYSKNINGSDYTGYGFLLKDGIDDGKDRGATSAANRGTNNRLAGIDNNAAAQSVDTKVEEMCTKIKADKIRLYTITFQLNDPSQQYLRDLFEACASDDGAGGKLFYNSPDNAALQTIFREIAQDLTNLRVVR